MIDKAEVWLHIPLFAFVIGPIDHVTVFGAP